VRCKEVPIGDELYFLTLVVVDTGGGPREIAIDGHAEAQAIVDGQDFSTGWPVTTVVAPWSIFVALGCRS
jgi:hypothetical protein